MTGAGGDLDPISVEPGKGWWVALPVPSEIVGRLGGPAGLAERLQPVRDATLGQYGGLSVAASDKLAAAYDELFQQITAVPRPPSDACDSAAGDTAVAGDPGNPIEVDQHRGRSAVLPVPAAVLARLGGDAQVIERLRPVLTAGLDPGAGLALAARDRLAAAYDVVLGQLAAIAHPEGRP